jgi:hypothetical protein
VEFVKQRIITLDPKFDIEEESKECGDRIQGLEVQPLSEDGSAMVIPTFVLFHDKVIVHEVATKKPEKKDEEEDGDEEEEGADVDNNGAEPSQPANPLMVMDDLLAE